MRLLVLGAGALGSFLGARLALGGHEVTLVARAAQVAAIRARGLVLIEPGGERLVAGLGLAERIAAALDTGPFDQALITVKAYDTAHLVEELSEAAGRDGSPPIPPLVCMQNGVGNEEVLAGLAGADGVVAGASETPVSVPRAGVVQVHRTRFRMGVAPVGAGAPSGATATALRSAGLAVQHFGDYRGLKWSKLLMNLLANASCAILDWTPAQVMAHPDSARLEALAWQETLAVMAAGGVHPVALAGYPLNWFAPIARRLSPLLFSSLLRRLVAGGRGGKRPSLHMALAQGKRSEVAWLNGAVAREGDRLGIMTPVNFTLARVLGELAEGHDARENWRDRPERLLASVQEGR